MNLKVWREGVLAGAIGDWGGDDMPFRVPPAFGGFIPAFARCRFPVLRSRRRRRMHRRKPSCLDESHEITSRATVSMLLCQRGDPVDPISYLQKRIRYSKMLRRLRIVDFVEPCHFQNES